MRNIRPLLRTVGFPTENCQFTNGYLMIGGITKGSDFAGCVRYALALDEVGKEARLLHSEGLLTDTPQDIINGFECQRHLNKTDKGDDFHIKHLGNFIMFLMKLGVEHRIQHFAIAFSKAQYDHPNAVKSAYVTCIRLH